MVLEWFKVDSIFIFHGKDSKKITGEKRRKIYWKKKNRFEKYGYVYFRPKSSLGNGYLKIWPPFIGRNYSMSTTKARQLMV